MTIVPTRNFYSALRAQLGCSSQPLYATDETTKSFVRMVDQTGSNGANMLKGGNPFMISGTASGYGTTTEKAVFEASSSSNITANIVTTPDKVGTVTSSFSNSSKGQVFTITVVGSGLEDETVRAFTYGKRFMYAANNYTSALFYSIVLDNPVVLNSENNYTAAFSFAVEFN